MPSSPLVSIILVTYNQGKWLREAVDSVVAQTYPSWELMLVDNGSTDDTRAVVAEYAHDPRVRSIVYETNQKHTVASNRAIAESRGELIAFLCGDDYFLPRKLERQVEKFATLPADFGAVYCDTVRVDDRTKRTSPTPMRRHRGMILDEFFFVQPFEPIAPMVRRECCLRYRYNEDVFMEGEALFGRIAMTYAYDYVDEVLCAMRDHDQNMGKEIEPSLHRNVRLYEAWFAEPDFPAALHHRRGPTLANLYRVKGWQTIRTTRRYRQGRGWLVEAVRLDPRSLANGRVLLGLGLSALPTVASDRLLDVLNLFYGAPPRPPIENFGP